MINTAMSNDSKEGNSTPPPQRLVGFPGGAAKKKTFLTAVMEYFSWHNRRTSLEESVVELIEEHDPQGVHIGEEERALIHNVLELNDSVVDDIKVPRSDIIAVVDTISLEELKQVVEEEEHTRMPVYQESLDNILGFVHIKDLISYIGTDKPFNTHEVIHKALFVAPSMRVSDLLTKMRSSRVHMAIVLDEFGGTDGLVTLEDLVEEIVGEINDEHDDMEEEELRAVNESTLEASARLDIEKLEERFGIQLHNEQEEDIDTVGGLVVSLCDHVPQKGEKIRHADSGIIFEILDADPRRVKRLLIYHNQ